MSKPGCHLCEAARAVLTDICAETGHTFTEVDITSDAELQQIYGETIPVVLVDGVQVSSLRIDPDRVRAALSPRPATGMSGIFRRRKGARRSQGGR